MSSTSTIITKEISLSTLPLHNHLPCKKIENNDKNINDYISPFSLFSFFKDLFPKNTDPSHFSSKKKTSILCIIAIASSLSPLSATIYYPAIFKLQNEFQTTDIMITASISIFTFTTAIVPLFWAKISEKKGRRHVYLFSFLIAIIGNLLCALAINMPMLIASRGIAAIGSSSVMSMGAGSLSDIYEAHERARAYAWYTLAPLLGPALGIPVIGGLLAEKYSWRSSFWFAFAATCCVWFAMLFFLPETSRTTPSESNEMNNKRKWSNPFSALSMYKYPNIALTVCFTGVLYMVFFTVNSIFTRTYTQQYHLSTFAVGLCYFPMALGTLIGSMIGGQISDKRYNHQVAKANGESNPEMRLGGYVFYGAIIFQCIFFIAYGWSVQQNIHWAYGLIFLFFAGICLMIPYVSIGTYIVDCFRSKSASVTACNNLMRYGLSGCLILFSSQLQDTLHDGPLFTILGCLILFFSINLIITKYMSARWRSKTNE